MYKAANFNGDEGPMNIYFLTDPKVAKSECNKHKNSKNGIFIVSYDLSRGLDMKFGEDSYVVCYDDSSDPLTYTDFM